MATPMLVLGISALISGINGIKDQFPRKIPIGAMFRSIEQENGVQTAVNFAIDFHNKRKDRPFNVTLNSGLFKKDGKLDAWNIFQTTCDRLESGFFSLLSHGDHDTYSSYRSLMRHLKMPYINWHLPPQAFGGTAELEVTIRPPLDDLLADTIRMKKWDRLIYLYDPPEGIHLLHRLYEKFNKNKNHALKVTIVQLPERMEDFPAFIDEFHSSRNTSLGRRELHRVLIYLKDSGRQEEFLTKLHASTKKTSNFHYLIANFDFDSDNVELFSGGHVNISGFQLIDRDRQFYWKFANEYEKYLASLKNQESAKFAKISVDAALAYDSVLVTINALERSARERPGIFNESFRRDQMYNRTKTKGLSGEEIRFNKDGLRQNFEVSLIELIFNANSAYSSTVSDPFLMRVDDKSPSVEESNLEGYCVDLVALLARTMKLSFRIQVVKDGGYGSEMPDGSWNGMIGELLRGEADLAVAPLTINRFREKAVDFSKPFLTTGLSIMIRKPDQQKLPLFRFLSPLSKEIWMYILFAYIGVSVVIFLVSRFSPYEWRVEELPSGGFTISNDFSAYNCLWFTLAAFMQQGTDILPRSVSGRIASSAWWFFNMIIVSSYTANLAAFLTLEKMQAPIESVEDLAKQTKIKYGIKKGGSTETFFKESTVQIYQRMWQYMIAQHPSVFSDTYDEGIERVMQSKRYAFILEETGNEFANTRKPCETMKVGENLNSIGFGVATPFGSRLKNDINLAILELQETGELKKLRNKWWYDLGECGEASTDPSTSLTAGKVKGIFFVLCGGMVIAMIAALAEFLYRSRIEARKGKRCLTSSMKSQLNLSLYGDRSTKGDLLVVEEWVNHEGEGKRK